MKNLSVYGSVNNLYFVWSLSDPRCLDASLAARISKAWHASDTSPSVGCLETDSFIASSSATNVALVIAFALC